MRGARSWAAIAGGVLTVAMAAGVARALAGGGTARLGGALPGVPAFYALALFLYLVPPAADWIIFRRLWRIPVLTGFAACLRKRVANEVVLGYSGEAFFYAWARSRNVGDAPFAAVKDVAVLSALVGNGATLLALVAAAASPALDPRLLAASAALLMAMTLPLLLLRHRVFSLPAACLWWIAGVHTARIALATLVAVLAWAALVPGVPAASWAMLAAGRLLVSRLPLVPNKELLFVNLAVLWLGDTAALSAAAALVAALTLVLHVATLVVLGVGWALARRRAAAR